MSDSSRTDLYEAAWRESGLGGNFSPVELCRQLERELAALRAERDEAVRLLRPFAHDDLCALLGGNAEGDESIIFVRNSAVLRISDCRAARALIAKIDKEANDGQA